MLNGAVYESEGTIGEIFEDIRRAMFGGEQALITPIVPEPIIPGPGDPIHVGPGLFPGFGPGWDVLFGWMFPEQPEGEEPDSGGTTFRASYESLVGKVFTAVVMCLAPHARGAAHQIGSFVFSHVNDAAIALLRKAWNGPQGALRINTLRSASEGHVWTRSKGGDNIWGVTEGWHKPNLPRWDPNEELWNKKAGNPHAGENHPYINPEQVRI